MEETCFNSILFCVIFLLILAYGLGRYNASPYAKRSGVSWVAGEDIRPMSVDEVIAWLESRELVDELEALFPNELEEA